MKIISKALIAAIISMSAASVAAQSSRTNDVTQAVLGVYEQELKEEPQNYNVFFRRAHLYYGLNQYMRALSDIDNAIRYTPDSDKDMLAQEHALRANIYLMTDRPADALADMTKAYEADPTSYVYLYQKANIEFELEKYAEAKEDFRRLQRFHNRSLESLIGLARIAVKENNLGLANEYVDQAVNLYPAEADAYIRRASVRALIGNNTGAVDDLLVALSIEKNSSKAISEIVKMSNKDYNAVISGLSNAISQAPEVGMFYYIRATIAQAHYHYVTAINDYGTIIEKNLYNYHGIHGALAECYYALCQFDKALDEINYAIGMTTENASYYVTRSKIRLALGNAEVAMQSAEAALDKAPDDNKALIQKAYCAAAAGDFVDASNFFGEAIINAPDAPLSYIMRGWILTRDLNQRSDGNAFFNRCVELAFDDTNIDSLKGFALAALGKTDEAKAWIDACVAAKPNDVDGHLHYLAACLYGQLDDLDNAYKCMDRSLEIGYGNLYDWTVNKQANLNCEPLRGELRFESLLQKYDFLFNEEKK